MDNFTSNSTNDQDDSLDSADGAGKGGFKLPDPPKDTSTKEKEDQPNQKQLLLAAAELAEYWHDNDKEGYASIFTNGGRQHCKIRSKTYKNWLSWQVYKLFRSAVSSQAMEDVLRILEAKAKYEGPTFETHVRIAGNSDTTFLQLADDAGTIYQIDAKGVQEASDVLIKFLSKPGMKALPKPIIPETIEQARLIVGSLRSFCNLKDEDECILFLVVLLSALRPLGPFVIIVVVGEQGSAKSTLCKIFRRLIDPSTVPLRSAPREERDLLIAANNSWVITFDNVSYIKGDLSDAMCRLATGGGNGYRTLYENDQETLFQAIRQILLNTIAELGLRGDVLDRAIKFTCLRIDEDKRLTEESFWQSFELQEAEILGALLLVLSETLKQLPNTKLDRSPRMADFARFGVAVEKAMEWKQGTFLSAYQSNRDALVAGALENQLADEITSLTLPIKLKPTELWDKLCVRVEDNKRLPKWFPANPQQLSSQLRRLAPFLRQRNIEVEFSKSGNRFISIWKIEPDRMDSNASNSSTALQEPENGSPQTDALYQQVPRDASAFESTNDGSLDGQDALKASCHDFRFSSFNVAFFDQSYPNPVPEFFVRAAIEALTSATPELEAQLMDKLTKWQIDAKDRQWADSVIKQLQDGFDRQHLSPSEETHVKNASFPEASQELAIGGQDALDSSHPTLSI